MHNHMRIKPTGLLIRLMYSFLILIFTIIITSCTTTKPVYDEPKITMNNDIEVYKNPKYQTELNWLSTTKSYTLIIGSTVGGAYIGYMNPYKNTEASLTYEGTDTPESERRIITSIAGGVLGLLSSAFIDALINGIILDDKNNNQHVYDERKWLNEFNEELLLINTSTAKTYDTIYIYAFNKTNSNRIQEHNFEIQNINDVILFNKLFPESQYTNGIFAQAFKNLNYQDQHQIFNIFSNNAEYLQDIKTKVDKENCLSLSEDYVKSILKKKYNFTTLSNANPEGDVEFKNKYYIGSVNYKSLVIIKNPICENEIILTDITEQSDQTYHDIRDFIGQPIKIKDKWGVINEELEFTIHPKYDLIKNGYSDNTYWIFQGKEGDSYRGSGLIEVTKNGVKTILQPIYKHINNFSKNLFLVSKIINGYEQYGIIKNDSVIVPIEYNNYRFSNSGFDGFIRLAKLDNNQDTIWGLYLVQNDKLFEQLPIKYHELGYRYDDCTNGKYKYLVQATSKIDGSNYETIFAKTCDDITARELIPPTRCKEIEMLAFSGVYNGTIYYDDGERQKFKIDIENYSLITGVKITDEIKNQMFQFWKQLKQAIVSIDKKKFSEMTVYDDQVAKNNFINGFYEIFPSYIRSVFKEQTETFEMFEFENGMKGFIAYYRTNLDYDTYRFVFFYSNEKKKWLLQEIKIFD